MKRYSVIVFLCVVLLVGLFVFAYAKAHDGKLHVIFCDVGQGDAVLIRTSSQKLLIYDAGPDESILGCLGKHTPFWQKTIDMVILSHPHSDHFLGMFSVFPHYTIKSYVSETLVNRSSGFEELTKELARKSVPVHHLKRGSIVRLPDGVMLTVLGPSQSFLEKTSPRGVIGESGEFASLVILLQYKDFSMLLTGDSQVSGLREALEGRTKSVTILHVPHHGSKTGLDESLVKRVNPEIAIISVGKNKYGHPSPKVMNILGDNDVKILRTDEGGDIEIVSDGKIFAATTEH